MGIKSFKEFLNEGIKRKYVYAGYYGVGDETNRELLRELQTLYPENYIVYDSQGIFRIDLKNNENIKKIKSDDFIILPADIARDVLKYKIVWGYNQKAVSFRYSPHDKGIYYVLRDNVSKATFKNTKLEIVVGDNNLKITNSKFINAGLFIAEFTFGTQFKNCELKDFHGLWEAKLENCILDGCQYEISECVLKNCKIKNAIIYDSTLINCEYDDSVTLKNCEIK